MIWDLKVGAEIINSEFKQFMFAKEKSKNNDMMATCKVVSDELLSSYVKMTEAEDLNPAMSIILPFDPATNKFKIFGLEVSVAYKYVWLYTNDSYPTQLKGRELAELQAFVKFNWNISRLLFDQKLNHFQETSTIQGFSMDFVSIPEQERSNYSKLNFYAMVYHVVSATHYDREYPLGEETPKEFINYVNENCLEQVDFRRHHANLMACAEVEAKKEEILPVVLNYVNQFRQSGEIIEKIDIPDFEDLNSLERNLGCIERDLRKLRESRRRPHCHRNHRKPLLLHQPGVSGE